MQKAQLTKEEGQALVQSWRASGKSIQEYCKEHMIPTHRINYWKKQFGEINPKEEGINNFLPIELKSKSSTPQYEIQTPGGYIIRIYTHAQLSELVRQLR
jgi:transposase-like protein